ncbi:MAG: O-antigen ligase family protein [Bdellovibrionota bacterium]
MWINIIRLKILPWTLGLYSLAVMTTMAGMEIFGWLSATLILSVLVAGLWKPRLYDGIWFRADWALVGLFGVVVLGASITAPSPPVGWGWDTIVGSARFVFLFMLLRLGISWTWSDVVSKRIVYGLIGVAALIGIYSVFQFYTGLDLIRGEGSQAVTLWGYRSNGQPYYRAAGMWDHPLRYSYFVGMNLCFAFAFFVIGMGKVGKHARWWMALAFVLMCLGLMASLARGAWIAVVVAILVMSFYSGWKKALGAVSVIAIALGLAIATQPEISDRLKTIFDLSNESNSSRFPIWKANWLMFLDQPIIGVGYGQNEAIIGEYFQRMGMPDDAFKGHAHNNYLQFLSGTGILGFACYMIFIGFYYWLAHSLYRRSSDPWTKAFALGAVGMQIVMHVGGFTEANFKSAQVNQFFMLALAVLSVVYVRSNQTEQVRR